METAVTEALALGTLISLSEAAIKRSNIKNRDAVLNALNIFGADFLPESEFKPKKYGGGSSVSPYEMAYAAVKAADSVELKVLWYVFYPYLVVASPHIEEELYDATEKMLCAKNVLEAVLSSRYRELIYDCAEDLQAAGLAGVYREWYAPYTEYKRETLENGDTREIAQYKKLLASGDFDAVIRGTDRLLDYDPYDTRVALLNIAARVSRLSGGTKERAGELNETINFIDGYISECADDTDLTYLHYYRAMCLLGLCASGADVNDAKAEFEKCLEITPNFELASFMLKAIDKKLTEKAQA